MDLNASGDHSILARPVSAQLPPLPAGTAPRTLSPRRWRWPRSPHEPYATTGAANGKSQVTVYRRLHQARGFEVPGVLIALL